jgi:ribulose-5-phosphate 4-epimerase/fuculose-1-phosphate aldolase
MPESSLHIPSRRGQCSDAEWALRVNLAAAYRLVALFGWDDLVFTHISARLPDAHDRFLINPYGLMFEEITASSLITVGADGQKLDESPYPVNPAGFTIHSAVHEARQDVECVMHTHSLNGVAVAAQRDGLLPLSQHSIFVLASLGYHGYEGVALNDDEKPRLVADLGNKTNLMLRNHGLLTVGKTVADAFTAMYFFEASCTIQVRAQAGRELLPIDQRIIDGALAQARQSTGGGAGALVWPGLLRRLQRQSPGFDS